jgi:hypothetical protein
LLVTRSRNFIDARGRTTGSVAGSDLQPFERGELFNGF